MYDLTEDFRIDNDNKADWALRVIRDNNAERDRLINIAKAQIDELNAQIEEITTKYDSKSSYLKNLLAEYVMSVPRKETKTQETYQLLTGKLIVKKASQKMVPNDEALVKYLESEKLPELIKAVYKPDWAEFKKTLSIIDGNVVNTATGEMIPAEVIAIEDTPSTFDIKLNKEDAE